MSFNIRGNPTTVVYDGGKEIARQSGAVSYDVLESMQKQAPSLV
jgi:hypothetical protein